MDNSNDNKVDVNTDLDDCSNKKRFSLKYLADDLMKNRVKLCLYSVTFGELYCRGKLINNIEDLSRIFDLQGKFRSRGV